MADRRHRNFCEFFAYSRAPYTRPDDESRAANARAKLDALFGGKPAERPAAAPPVSAARARLEALFRTPAPEDDDE